MSKAFEFHSYPDDRIEPVVSFVVMPFSAAKSKAGRMAKKGNGPVDLALADTRPWNQRYITTARPSEYHAAGYAFKRTTD